MKLSVFFCFVILSFVANANRLPLGIGWSKWKASYKYYQDSAIESIHYYKRKNTGSTTTITRHKVILYDTNGKWYFKERYRSNTGCFHYKVNTIWMKVRKRSDGIEFEKPKKKNIDDTMY